MTEAIVSLDEIATATGRRVPDIESEAPQWGLSIREDWRDRPALSVAEAKALVSGTHRRDLEHEQGWARHLAECKDWRAGRDQAARDAARKVRDQAGRGVPAGMVAAEAQRAATAAAQDYERTVPRPRFNGTTAAPLEYISLEEAPG
jgi:hypothetical protein